MSYIIKYGVSKAEQKHQHGKVSNIWLIALAVLVTTLIASVIWPDWAKAFRKELFPIFSAEGLRAVQSFSDSLEMGSTLSDAIEVFCREIINGSVS